MVEKTYKLSDLKLVKVDWLDAMSDDNTWQELEELTKQVLRPVSCVGWILTETKDNIILISSFLVEYSDNSFTSSSEIVIGKIPFLKQLL